MGDRAKQAPPMQLDGKLKLEFQGARLTSDVGLLPFRELDETFGLTEKGSHAIGARRLAHTSVPAASTSKCASEPLGLRCGVSYYPGEMHFIPRCRRR